MANLSDFAIICDHRAEKFGIVNNNSHLLSFTDESESTLSDNLTFNLAVKMTKFILETSYPSETNHPSQTDNSSQYKFSTKTNYGAKFVSG